MKTLKRLQIVLLILLGISLIVSVDLAHNFLNASFVELHDGIRISGIFSRLFFGDDYWSLNQFYQGFIVSLRIAVALGIGNIVLKCIRLIKE